MGDVTAFLEDLVRIPSPSGEEGKALERFAGEAESLGFDVSRQDVGNVLAQSTTGEPDVLLAGHIDTVPGQIPVQVEDGVLHGRGTVDAKGPLACFLHAAAKAPEDLDLAVAALVGEEIDSRGARALLETGIAADHVVIGEPSGADGVTVAYRGTRDVRIEIERPGHHPGHPTPNAADELIALVSDLRSLSGTGFEDLGVHVRDVDAAEDGNASHAEATVNLRFADESLLEAVQDRLADVDGDVDVTYHDPPVQVDRTAPVVRALVGAIRDRDDRPRLVRKTGTCDMNLLQDVTDSICAYGPGDSALDHTPDERVRLDEVEAATDVVSAGLERLAAGE